MRKIFFSLIIGIFFLSSASACIFSNRVEMKSDNSFVINLTRTGQICLESINISAGCYMEEVRSCVMDKSGHENCGLGNQTLCYDYNTTKCIKWGNKTEVFQREINCRLFEISIPLYGYGTEIFGKIKDSCGLSDSDVSILTDFIKNGYDVKEQSEQEYEKLLEEAKTENWAAVARKGRWTGYVNSPKTPLLQRLRTLLGKEVVAERGCGSVNILWNDLKSSNLIYYIVILAIAVAIALGAIIIKFRRHKNE